MPATPGAPSILQQGSGCAATPSHGTISHLAISDGYVHVHDDALDLDPCTCLALHPQWRLQLLDQGAELDGWDEVGGVGVQLRPDLRAHMQQQPQRRDAVM